MLHDAKMAPNLSQFPTAVRRSTCVFGPVRSPFQHLERSSSAESQKKSQDGYKAWKYVSTCIAARVTLFALSLHCCRLARLQGLSTLLLRFSSSSSSGVPTLILHNFEQRYWVLSVPQLQGFAGILHVWVFKDHSCCRIRSMSIR